MFAWFAHARCRTHMKGRKKETTDRTEGKKIYGRASHFHAFISLSDSWEKYVWVCAKSNLIGSTEEEVRASKKKKKCEPKPKKEKKTLIDSGKHNFADIFI